MNISRQVQVRAAKYGVYLTPAVREVSPDKAQRAFSQIIQVRDGAVAIVNGAKAVGKDGILIERNVGGDVIGAGGKKITGSSSDDR